MKIGIVSDAKYSGPGTKNIIYKNSEVDGYKYVSELNVMIYDSEKDELVIFDKGLQNGYSGKIIKESSSSGSVSGSSVYLGLINYASDTMAIFSPIIDFSQYSSVTLNITSNVGNWDGDGSFAVYVYPSYSNSVWDSCTYLGGIGAGSGTGTYTFNFNYSGTGYIAVRRVYGTSGTFDMLKLNAK